MQETVVAELLKTGLLGALLLVAIYAVWTIDKKREEAARRSEEAARVVAQRHEEQLMTIHAQRVSDHQAMTAQVVHLTTDCVAVLTTVGNGMEAINEALREWKGPRR